jgi:hypothetical protein
MKGFRTIAVGFAMAIGPAALTYLLGLDWTKLVGPNAALFVAGLLQIGMRVITTTPVGKDTP